MGIGTGSTGTHESSRVSFLRTIELGEEEKEKASSRHLGARVNGFGRKGTSDDIKMDPASLRDLVTVTRRVAHSVLGATPWVQPI